MIGDFAFAGVDTRRGVDRVTGHFCSRHLKDAHQVDKHESASASEWREYKDRICKLVDSYEDYTIALLILSIHFIRDISSVVTMFAIRHTYRTCRKDTSLVTARIESESPKHPDLRSRSPLRSPSCRMCMHSISTAPHRTAPHGFIRNHCLLMVVGLGLDSQMHMNRFPLALRIEYVYPSQGPKARKPSEHRETYWIWDPRLSVCTCSGLE